MSLQTDLGPAPAVASPATPVRQPANPWIPFLAKRLFGLVGILAVLVVVTFSLVRLIPGDPTLAIAGLESSQEARERARVELGLDQPFLAQLGSYVNGLLHGNLGNSFITKQPIADILTDRFALSGRIALLSLVVVMLISVPLGIIAAAYTRDDRHRKAEVGFTAVTSVAGAIPEFLMATVLATVFAVWLKVLPVAGLRDWNSYILPVAAIALRPTFLLARIVRVETFNVLAQDYIRTARSKRLSNWRIYVRHVLPNVVTASLTVGGILLASLIAGAVLVENVFALPGLGTALVDAVERHDYPVIQGIVLLLGVVVVVINTLVDVALAIVDPRSLTRSS